MEVRVARGPIRNSRKGMRHQDILQERIGILVKFTLLTSSINQKAHLGVWMNQTHAVLIDRYQKHLWIIWLRGLFHFEEG